MTLDLTVDSDQLPTSSAPDDGIDVTILLDAVRRMLGQRSDDWHAVVDMGLVLLCRDGWGTLTDALQVLIELGRASSSLPLAETIVLNLFAPGLMPADARIAILCGEAGGDRGAGTATVVGGRISGRFRLVEGAASADILAILGADGDLSLVNIRASGVAIETTPAVTANLCDVTLKHVHVDAQCALDGRASDMMAVLRLCLFARALGAATQGFEAVTDYAKVRRQFGQTIGSFQAIQHKLANSRIALSAASLQAMAAARAYDGQTEQWHLLCDAAVACGSPAIRDVALQTQHAFGAIGFADEHEAPTQFRRIHSDLARLGGARQAQQRLGAYVLGGTDGALMALLADNLDPAGDFRRRLRDWLATNWTSDHRAERALVPFPERDWDLDFLTRLGRDGWTALNWPAAYGGMAASPFEQLAFTEELQKVGAPEHAMICPCRIIAPEIIHHGSDRLRESLLPRIRAGIVTGCLGYSEPESGSDLASLRTSAIRDGDDYIINGQKIWTTDGHRASHMILAARTDPDLTRRHAGVSLFVLPMDHPGITIRQMTGLHGHVFCSIFFDNVRLPADHRLGEEGQGWPILSNALANERITMGGFVSRQAILLSNVLDALRADGTGQDRATHIAVGALVARLLAGRMLAVDSIVQMAKGGTPLVEAAMAKVYASELAQEICETSLDLLGGRGLLAHDAPDAPAQGLVDEMLRLSIMYVVGGGSNEIQRSLIAGRGLGLGR